MEDQLSDYKALHQKRYQEREAKREAVLSACKSFDGCVSIPDACQKMRDLLTTLEDPEVTSIIRPELGMDILQGLNENVELKVSMMDRNRADELHSMLKVVMEKLGCDPDVKLEFDMDCSKDEEIARALAQTFIDDYVVPPPAPRRTRRPRRPRVASTQPNDGT